MTTDTESTTVAVHYSNGETAEYPSRSAAITALEAEYPELEILTQPHVLGGVEVGERTLCWEDGETAENDDGAEAFAEILDTAALLRAVEPE